MMAEQAFPAPALTAESAAFQAARERRADLRHVMVDLEAALAAPVASRAGDWALRVHDKLVDVAAAFERHIAATEGPGGLFREITHAAPRLSNGVAQLGTDHQQLRREMADLLESVRRVVGGGGEEQARTVRSALVMLLGDLARHRQLGADLVYEAYAVDIGVGD